MGWFSDIVRAYPEFVQETERLAALDAENIKRKKENSASRTERLAELNQQQFVAFNGMLWMQRDGKVDAAAYCPSCKIVLAVGPHDSNENIVCSRCDFIAPFQLDEIEKFARSLEAELDSL